MKFLAVAVISVLPVALVGAFLASVLTPVFTHLALLQ
jgi:hypothetical protein